jgi:TolA-binding protein
LPEGPAYTPPDLQEPGINFSRVVRATVGQLVEVPFRGTGWVYLGELGSRPGIVYNSRRLDPDGQSFVFHVEAAGIYGLKFYKQDFFRDYILNDFVQVIAGEPVEATATGWFNPAIDRGRVVAEPRWPNALEEAELIARVSGAVPEAGSATTGTPAGTPEPSPTTPSVPTATSAEPGTQAGAQATATAPVPVIEAPGREPARPPASDEGVLPLESAALSSAPVMPREPVVPGKEMTPSEYLDAARREYEAGRVATALAVLDQFRERYPAGTDEAWWLYGQFYEAGSPSRDTRAALDYYRRLVQEYPQSRHYNEARRRIAYLERYYINIR